MLEEIRKCTACALWQNQIPLLDKEGDADIIWVGLSAKKVENPLTDRPLANNTATGAVINEIESKFPQIKFYRTNLVKCLPLDGNEELRYPTTKEMSHCVKNLEKEIESIKPKIVFLLGGHVIDTVSRFFQIKFDSIIEINFVSYLYKDINFIPIHHPSYINVYKKKLRNNYIKNIEDLITGITKISALRQTSLFDLFGEKDN